MVQKINLGLIFYRKRGVFYHFQRNKKVKGLSQFTFKETCIRLSQNTSSPLILECAIHCNAKKYIIFHYQYNLVKLAPRLKCIAYMQTCFWDIIQYWIKLAVYSFNKCLIKILMKIYITVWFYCRTHSLWCYV